ncbi:MAG: MarR family winged helix-turn-helix transcriptional regulator [Candidatus Limnocylindrales bacterium]
MSSAVPRSELVAAVLRAVREESGQAVLFSQAVAERVGLAGTDVECLEMLQAEGRATVGRLAELTGLTTGAATRMVDRLEQAGYVNRVADPTDRRRVLVEPAPGLAAKFGALHASIAKAQLAIIEHYDDNELAILIDFLDRSRDVARAETLKMRAPSEEANPGGSYAAPVGGVTSGRLVFLSGAPRITVRGDSTLTELYRARFAGPVPRMRVRGGVVTVSYPRFGWFDWRAQIAGQTIDASAHWNKDTGEIALSTAVPWSIELRGGVSSWTADLRALRLESFELRGGASKVELLLSRPTGVVPIRVTGGLSRISIERPLGVAVGLEVRGGIGEVTIDGQTHKAAGRLSIQTPGAQASPDRYEIDVAGSVSRMLISAR